MMLWGRGDSSKLTEEEQATLQHIRRMVETGHIYDLDHEKTQMLLRALDWYGDWEGTFRTMRHLRNVIGLFAFFFVSWWATDGSPIAFFTRVMQ